MISMKMYVFVFVLSVLVAVGQSTKIDGPCPIKMNRTETFDPKRYVGKWHDIYTSPVEYSCEAYDIFECQLIYISEYNENDHYFTVTNYHGLHYGNFCSQRFYQTDHNVDGRLLRHYSGDERYYVLDTDYDNYAVEIGCVNNDDVSHEEIFVLRSRNMTMPDEVRDRLVKKIVNYGFTEQKLLKRLSEGCVEFDPGY